MGRRCSTRGKDENLYENLVGKPHGKILIWKPRNRCEDNTKINLNK